MNIDQEVAERLGLEIHDIITREIHPAPDGACEVILKCSCGHELSSIVHCITAQGMSTRFSDKHSNPSFSTSTATLKAEAIRAGKWDSFLDWHHKMCWITVEYDEDRVRTNFMLRTFCEILTTPELLAQAFLSYLKEVE